MVKLDYRTNNPRGGLRGMKFENWESYSFTLGYLSNPNHYNNKHPYPRGFSRQHNSHTDSCKEH